MNIYELTQNETDILNVLETVEDESVKQILAEALIENREMIGAKVEAYAHVLANLEAERDALKLEADKFIARAKTKGNDIARIRQTLEYAMQALDVKELAGGMFKFTLQKNGGKQPMTVDESAPIPDEYWQVETVKHLDKELIRAALEDGEELPFAKLEERGESLRLKLR